MTEEIETYLRVLGAVTSAEGFISLLDEAVTMDAGRTDNLWQCGNYHDLVELARRAYEAGVRVEVLDSHLVGNRMLLCSRIERPDSAFSEELGPVAGQTVWRIFTLHESRIVHIQDFATREDAVVALIAR
jgi:hypothetical protein